MSSSESSNIPQNTPQDSPKQIVTSTTNENLKSSSSDICDVCSDVNCHGLHEVSYTMPKTFENNLISPITPTQIRKHSLHDEKCSKKCDHVLYEIYETDDSELKTENSQKEKEFTFSDLKPLKQSESVMPKSEISKNEVEFLRKLMKKASEAKNSQYIVARRIRLWNDILSTSSNVLALLSGSAGLGGSFMLESDDPAFPALLTLSIITLGAGILGVIKNTLKFEDKLSQRKETISGYSSIITKTAQFLSTPGTDRKDVEIFTNSITLEMNMILSRELL